jgi:GAF domain-containing protein
MKRRSRAAREPIKGPRRKTPEPTRRSAPKAATRLGLSAGLDETEVAQLIRERDEALEQQTATSEVLRVISASRGELEPIFRAMLERAIRICEAKFGALNRFDGNTFHLAAQVGASRELAEFRSRRGPFKPTPGGLLDRVMRTKEVNFVADITTEPSGPATKLGKARSVVCVPMLRDDALIGVITIYRQEVRPFTGKQIELVQNFAAQAVIAIENARLLNELRQRTADLTERTADLTEALEQQTATSEVLQVISSSPGELEPIFATMLEKAVRICDANFGNIYRWDGETGHLVATYNTPPAFAEHRRRFPHYRPNPKVGIGRMFATKEMISVADVRAEASYVERRDPSYVAAVELGGVRSYIAVPMLKEGELIGGFTLSRHDVRPFTNKQIELVKNFAAQAVIAIENARLLNELRQRTNDLTERTVDLTEALEQQTATSEVLQAISSSPGEVEQVFTAMLEKAVRICDAAFGNIFRWDGSTLQLVAGHKTPPAFAEARRQLPVETAPNGPIGRMIRTKAAVHIADLARDQLYLERSLPALTAAVELGGVRTLLVVPLLKEREPIGAFALSRQEVRPFTDKQIELVQNFAAQAVIAIENTRLLNELRERTEEVEKLNKHLEQRVTDQVDEIERMGRLRRFLPPQVADLIVASGSEKQLESHRREITALFCDLRGFTGFTESADAEDVMALLREYHTAIGEIIIKYNGTLERYAGDGVMVIFNDPVPVENPALQAVLMALEVREAIGSLTETWRRWGHELGFGIGIAHGFATLGTIGFEGRFDYAAIGTVSNVASRLCDEARPGQILISPRVLTKVENAVQVEPVGEFELKGIRRPLAAYNVVAIQSSDI